MSNTHRIAWLDAQIRAGRYPNATAVAARFEISRRQAARDIEYLRHSMGAPLEWCAQRNGYRYADDSLVMPAVVVSDDEAAKIAYLAEQYSGLDASVAAVLRRLAARGVVPDELSPVPLASFDGREARTLAALREAVSRHVVAVTRYRDPSGVVVTRTLEPYGIRPVYGALSCYAYARETGERRMFTLARFESVEVTDECVDVPAHLVKSDYGDDHTPLPPEPFVAVVRLDDQRDAERIESAVALGDGSYSIDFRSAAALLSVLMSCSSGFEIVRPRWLRERLAHRLRGLLERASTP